MSTALPVTLATFPATRVAYMRYTGPFGAPVGQFWQTRMYPFMLAHQLLHSTRYGISLDDPEITEPARCRYDACVEVSADFVPTGDALIATLPGGRYAVCPFSGTSETIPDAWRAVLREWIPESGLQIDNRPLLEMYGPASTYDPATGVFTCDICLPVAPL